MTHTPASAPSDSVQSVDLAARAKRGDDAALDQLLVRYRERARRIARIRMGARIRAVMDSEDVVQNAYVVAARRIRDFEVHDHSSIIRWLARIVENQIRDAGRAAGTQKNDVGRQVSLDQLRESDSAHPGFEPTAPDERPSDVVARNELREIYDACIAELPEVFREVVLLRELAESSWDDIAAELGRPSAAAARELYRRAQLKLASVLRARLGERG